MLRRLLRLGLAVLGLLALLLLALWISVRPARVAVPLQGLVVERVTIVNPGLERRVAQTLTVRGERIESIEPAAAGASGAFAGSVVLPGLIDLHVHHPPFFTLGERELFALLFLMHGVTSVRDVGSFVGTVRGHARRIESGRIPGPRIFSCGPLLDGDPPGWPGAIVVESPDAAQRAVRELAQSGVDCVKVYNEVSADVFDAIRDAAAASGLRTVAHVPWEVPFERIREAEVQHLMGLESHSWRVPERRIQRYVEASRAHGISHTPTLVVFARAAQLADYETLRNAPVARLLPRYYRELLWNPAQNPLVFEFSPAGGSGVEKRLGAMQEVVRRLHAAQVPVLAGTDTMNPFVVPGAGLQEELGHLVGAGLTLEEAWMAATSRAGEALGVADLGVLRSGAPADFLIFAEDPSRDLAALATLRAVVAAGRLYPVAMLEQAADRQRARLENVAYETLARLAARLGLAWIAADEG